jgi:hypothetical protein
MLNGMYYLNNSGHRWVIFENGKRASQTFTTKSGKQITRVVNYWEALGNFAVCEISYKGKKIKVFADTLLED